MSDIKIIVPPTEIEGGEIVREVSGGGARTAERWFDGKWVPFRALTNAELWYARDIPDEELRKRGITN
jgi:hypothetical protein